MINSNKLFFKRTIVVFLLVLLSLNIQAQKNLLKLPDYIAPKDRIAFALYTIHENTLKLTAQFYPIENVEPFEASLEVFINNEWKKIAETRIIYPGYTAPFRVGNWDDTKEVRYRVNHNNTAFYEGILRKNPIDKEEFVMAAFTCNSIYPGHGGDISREDIVSNVKKIKPDLLFFSGDQVYDHSQHYLYWLKFGKDFEEIIRNTPTITIPDDHDIGQGNLWGQGGKKATSRRGKSGGYYMPISYIQEVERAQTSHLPDPYDATPIERGIGVYYTDLKWGGMSFAILEDRKFKSGIDVLAEKITDVFPNGSYEAIFNPNVDTKRMDIEGLKLLGDRQLKFLEDWTTDWKDASMKTVLSQTIFSQVNNYSGKHDRELLADFDTNAWPQTGRNKALSVIRKSFSVMVAGDQHLGSVVKHGIDDYGDAGYSFCTPAIANFWLRWWDPKTPGANQEKNSPKYTGDFLDGFQNKMTVKAVGNPTLPEIKEGGKLSTRAAGYGIVRYNKRTRDITFDCWGRNINITDPKSKQYPGWPITINQTDNFTIQYGYELPVLKISKPNQVVTIVNSYTKDVISSLRIKGTDYHPKVLKEGEYDIIVGEGTSMIDMKNLKAKKINRVVKEVYVK
ncbi:alkaline phosphatase D family protein [Tenacibaculum sp. M341]|uniref:alkaline phosphatase D family protein n=1 Tax=Tenacibaculum sp. M341 TaxID=2530339 RepID=UPI00104E69CF|nr:alkaline phosphatase D family protein [Tenacibaculum sp. M341]TCI94175.1 hypothetical protein EYW44_02190 [Tenacibaculum sp. M341]